MNTPTPVKPVNARRRRNAPGANPVAAVPAVATPAVKPVAAPVTAPAASTPAPAKSCNCPSNGD